MAGSVSGITDRGPRQTTKTLLTKPMMEVAKQRRAAKFALLVVAAGAACLASCASSSADGESSPLPETGWSRFRGPNGSGVASSVGLPARFGPGTNEAWFAALPPGHSSPVIADGRIFLTAVEGESLYTYALDEASGTVLWRREAPRPRQEVLNRLNNPASPTPVVTADGVVVFFGDFGLLAYDVEGNDRWSLPLGPFDNAYGMAASPVAIDDLIIQVCDQKNNSFMLAVEAATGKVRWRVDRPGSGTGHSTPVAFRAADGELQLLVPGSFRLTAYAVASGEVRWWVSGLAFEMKAVPVLSEDSGTVYINGTSASAFEDSYDRAIPAFDQVADRDVDGDGRFQPEEIPDSLARRWLSLIDLDGDGTLNQGEWEWYRSARASRGGINAFTTGGAGDTTAASFLWNHDRSVPQLPSALLYSGVIYMVDDGGIVSLLDPADGAILDRGRISAAIDSYYASPVVADGKVFLVSESCKVTVLKPGTSLDIVAVNDLDDLCFATPAIASNRLYVRTRSGLYAFAESAPATSGG